MSETKRYLTIVARTAERIMVETDPMPTRSDALDVAFGTVDAGHYGIASREPETETERSVAYELLCVLTGDLVSPAERRRRMTEILARCERAACVCPDCGEPVSLQPSGWWSHDGLPGDCWRLSMDGPNVAE